MYEDILDLLTSDSKRDRKKGLDLIAKESDQEALNIVKEYYRLETDKKLKEHAKKVGKQIHLQIKQEERELFASIRRSPSASARKVVDSRRQDADRLVKEAIRYRKAGDIENALLRLRQAYEADMAIRDEAKYQSIYMKITGEPNHVDAFNLVIYQLDERSFQKNLHKRYHGVDWTKAIAELLVVGIASFVSVAILGFLIFNNLRSLTLGLGNIAQLQPLLIELNQYAPIHTVYTLLFAAGFALSVLIIIIINALLAHGLAAGIFAGRGPFAGVLKRISYIHIWVTLVISAGLTITVFLFIQEVISHPVEQPLLELPPVPQPLIYGLLALVAVLFLGYVMAVYRNYSFRTPRAGARFLLSLIIVFILFLIISLVSFLIGMLLTSLFTPSF